MDDILKEFILESKTLMTESETYLEKADEGIENAMDLKEFAIRIDRIMGSAKSMISMYPEIPALDHIGKLSEMGKMIGYRGMACSEEAVYNIMVAFLLDAVELLNEILDQMAGSGKAYLSKYKSLLDRLRWIVDKLQEHGGKESEMNELMKKLGLA